MRRGIPTKLDVDVEVRHGSYDQDVTIAFADKLSGTHFVEVRLTWEDFARLTLTNIHARPGTCELRLTDTLGKRRESDTVVLEAGAADILTRIDRKEENDFAQACATMFWQDHRDLYDAGWRVWGERTFNGHRRRALGGYAVSIERFVEAE